MPQCNEYALANTDCKGVHYEMSFKYLYTVGLLSPHILANSLTFICFAIKAG